MASLSHLISLLLLALFPCVSNGCFLITTPRRWTAGIRNIVCVMVSDPKESAALGFTLWKHMDLLRYRVTQVGPITKFSNVTLNPGEVNACVSVFVPKAATYKVLLRVQGRACGQNVFRQIEVTLAKPTYKIFLQTDKYQYKPSQEVLLRILAIEKVTLAISKTNYSVVWVTAPSGNRIAQWNNVDNSKGLVHLSFQLTDDPELGVHTIKVLPDADGDEYRANFSTSFTVEEYVLPRFEVTLIPPPYITGIANYYVFTVCARYTFGQPVQGSVALQVSDKKCDASMTKVEEIDGCLEIRIGAPLNFKRWSCRGDYLDVQATVTEAGTLTPIKVQKRISVYYYSIHFRVKIQDTYIKPYLPFRAKILARRPDKRPASGEPVEVCCSNVCTNTTSDPDGIITLVVPYCLEDNIQVRSMMCSRRMMDRPLSLSYTRFYSPSNSSLAIVTPDEPLRCSQGQYQERQLQLHVAHCNHTVFTLNVMVVARGVIQYIGSVDMDTREMEPLGTPEMVFPSIPWPENCHSLQTHFNISVSRFVSPFIRVVVWYTREDGEVVSDAKPIEVERCFNYQVHLALHSPTPTPGELASIQLNSEPNSLCSLGVVDKSVELLTPSHIASRINFTIDTVFRILSQYSRPEPFNNYDHINQYCRKKLGQEKHIWKQYSSKYVDALQVFDDTGLHVLTDETIETRPCEESENRRLPGLRFPSRTPLKTPIRTPLRIPSSDDESLDAPRTDFPDTWLWSLLLVPESGRVDESMLLPDTITQWVGRAVCVHDKLGVGMSNQALLTTFKSLFVDLTLPPNIKQGEILHVKISVFNYVNISLPITTILSSPHIINNSLELVVDPEDSNRSPGHQSSCVATNTKVVHTVKVKPSVAIGLLNLTVEAYVDNQAGLECSSPRDYSDIIIKPIRVVAKGFPRETTYTDYLCPDKDNADQQRTEREIAHPPDMVPGTFRSWFVASGDLLALTIENLGNLIRMPMGSGEQILVNLAPNTFILDYFTASQQYDIPRSLYIKLIAFIENGYQRELKYRHANGSFSAFGTRDDSGSTWLTAFVLKTFARASLYIKVDDAYLQDAQNWLLQQQSPGGCFTQVGRVIHKALKGGMEGLDSAVSLTAYVTVALLESEVWDNKKSTTPFLLKALKCLISTPSQDLYTMALKAYALALAKLPQAETLITRLLTIDAMETQSENQADEVKEVLRRPLRSIIDVSPKKSGRAVEDVAYVVLAMMTVNPEKHRTRAAKLVKWIVQERNGQGGFITTQATVVALQALALFSTYSTTKDMSVTLKVNTIDLDRTITIDQNNRLLQQLVQIPTVPTKFVYKAEGTGCVVVETVMRYSELNPSPSEAFKLSVKTITEPDHNCITKRFEACVASLLEYGVSYLAIIEVNLVSGYQPMRDDLRQMLEENSNVIKSYEIHDDMVVFYIDQFHTPQAVCVSFRMVRDATVEDVEPSTVVIYDYYHPSFKIRQYYTLPRSDECVNMDDYFKSSGDEKKTKQRNRIEILRKYMRGKS